MLRMSFKGGKYCCARECSSSGWESNQTSFFRLPKDDDRRKIWLTRARREDLLNPHRNTTFSSYRLCSKHFDDNAFYNYERKRLVWNANPTIFKSEEDISSEIDRASGTISITETASSTPIFNSPNEDDVNKRDDMPTSYCESAQLCRLCAIIKEDFVSIFTKSGTEINLLEKIHLHLPIEVKMDDELPLQVCNLCISKLEVCHEICQTSLVSQTRLKDILGQDCKSEHFGDACTTNSHHLSSSDSILLPSNTPTFSQLHSSLTNPTESKEDAQSADLQDLNYETCMAVGQTELSCEKVEMDSIQDETDFSNRSHQATNICYQNIYDQPTDMPSVNEESNNDVINSISNNHHNPQIYDDMFDMMIKSVSSNLENDGESSSGNSRLATNQCWLCDECFTEKDELIVHQLDAHAESVFCCSECDIVIYAKEAYDEHIALHNTLTIEEAVMHTGSTNCSGENFVDTDNKEWINRETLESTLENSTITMYAEEPNSEHVIVNLRTGICEETIMNHSDDIVLDQVLPGENLVSTYETESPSVPEREGNSVDVVNVNYEEANECKYLQTEELIEFEVNAQWSLKNGEDQNLNESSSKIEVIKLFDLKPNVPQDSFKESSSQRYGCQFCDKLFPTYKRWTEHIRVHTNEKPFRCDFQGCNKRFRIMSALKTHYYSHNEHEKPYVCNVESCGRRFGTRSGFAGHLETHDPSHSYLCDTCGLTLRYKTSLILHKKRKHGEQKLPTYTCDHCNKIYCDRYRLIEHLRFHNNVKPFKCKTCSKDFCKSSQLAQHKHTHSNSKYSCHICKKRFNRRGNMLVHVKRHSRSHRYTCLACNLPFDSLRDVAYHRKTAHAGLDVKKKPQKPRPGVGFKCDVCNKLLATKITLQNHILNLHEAVKAWKCDLCDLSFNAKTKLTNHRVIHSNMKPHPCQYCQDGYMTAEECLLHEQNHSKMERTKITLDKNSAIISDVRPFVCIYCEKGFRRRDTLESHILIHKGIKPFQCRLPGCNRAFRQKGDRNVHERRIHNNKDNDEVFEFFLPDPNSAFSCLLCGLVFNNNDELTFHYELSHAEQLADGSDTIVIDADALISFPEITVVDGNNEGLVLTDF